MTMKRSNPDKTVLLLLEDLGPSTTQELITEANTFSSECADRLPGTLVKLEKEGKIKKKLSREKKAIVWSLVD
ncbi:MAG: hypothetical protein ACXAEU_20135 [Candidatus Hodarchaeales archaeon]